MLSCRCCLRPLPFPWRSPCNACLQTRTPAESRRERSWQSSEIPEGRSALSLIGSSYRTFKIWKTRPDSRLNSWAQRLCLQPSELRWIRAHGQVLVPIPQSLRRSLTLGHWPAGQIAHWIQQETQLPVRYPLLPHVQGQQAQRSARLRSSTALHFEVNPKELQAVHQNRDQCWILIDDLKTSGNTLDAAARALRLWGVRGQIYAWTLGIRPKLMPTQDPLRIRRSQTGSLRSPAPLFLS